MHARLVSGLVAALAFSLILLGIAGPVAADPTAIEKFRGKDLVVYKEATGAPAKRILAPKLDKPLDIIGPPLNGRYKVAIDGKEWWVLKAQAVTNEKVAGPAVSCQSITTSYASSRGFADCKEKE